MVHRLRANFSTVYFVSMHPVKGVRNHIVAAASQVCSQHRMFCGANEGRRSSSRKASIWLYGLPVETSRRKRATLMRRGMDFFLLLHLLGIIEKIPCI